MQAHQNNSTTAKLRGTRLTQVAEIDESAARIPPVAVSPLPARDGHGRGQVTSACSPGGAAGLDHPLYAAQRAGPTPVRRGKPGALKVLEERRDLAGVDVLLGVPGVQGKQPGLEGRAGRRVETEPLVIGSEAGELVVGDVPAESVHSRMPSC